MVGGDLEADLHKTFAKLQPSSLCPAEVLAELPLPLHAENAERKRADTADVGVLEVHHGDALSAMSGHTVGLSLFTKARVAEFLRASAMEVAR